MLPADINLGIPARGPQGPQGPQGPAGQNANDTTHILQSGDFNNIKTNTISTKLSNIEKLFLHKWLIYIFLHFRSVVEH